MVASRAIQIVPSLVTLLAVATVSHAGTREVVRAIGPDFPRCSCQTQGAYCVHVIPQGTTCRLVFADSVDEAQQLRDRRCRDLHGGVDLVWESFRCVTQREKQNLQNRTRQVEQQALSTCGSGNYVVVYGWEPSFGCINPSAAPGMGPGGIPTGTGTPGAGGGATGIGTAGAGAGGPGAGGTPPPGGGGGAGAPGGGTRAGAGPGWSGVGPRSGGAGAGGHSAAGATCPAGQCAEPEFFGMGACRPSLPECPGYECGQPGCR
ncbi:MAG: hypothetical protein F9K20_08300 [Hyphomicrobium sp.]|nr:MAG: hypothetical protein F9K20_08300 [Hyphomicrobium sp.]